MACVYLKGTQAVKLCFIKILQFLAVGASLQKFTCVMTIKWLYVCVLLIMAAPWNRAEHYIFALWFLLYLLSFFPRLISAVADWMSAILAHMMWP